MGVGYVPAGPFRQERQGDDLSGREHRGTRTDLGALGEEIAARFLQDRGATIVARNVRIGRGELDLIVAFGDELAAVEVKTGSAGSEPIYHFDVDKQRQVRALAATRRIGRVDYVGVVRSADGVAVRWLPRVG
jgi:putative endonuclease